MDPDRLTLAAGDARVVVAPGAGGAIASFQWRGEHVLRATGAEALAAGNVRQHACYPLVPYSNRIANATLLTREGGAFPLARNFGEHPHAIHGVGWQRAWSIDAVEPARATLTLVHRPEGEDRHAWPFAFRAAQSFGLACEPDAAILTFTLAIENQDTRAFPFGLGWHPYFARTEATVLGFAAAGVWETERTGLPTRNVPVPGGWRFDPPRPIAATTLDNAFSGWTGRATLAWPSTRRHAAIEADRACGFLVVYIPRDGNFVVVEPVTHMTDAFNREALGASDTGTRWLRPGESHSCSMRIVATLIAS